MGTFLAAMKGIGALLVHLGEQAATDPAVEQAVATLVEKAIAARLTPKA